MSLLVWINIFTYSRGCGGSDVVERVLDPETAAAAYEGQQINMDEQTFRFMMNSA